ncbi:MAG TPA: TetR/AcrR family transcriptional regulator [Vicinamibacterales bacterium]
MRRTDTPRRDELLDSAAAYLLRHGVAGMSLRPMAAAIGTSARLLIYHFGTKERLLVEAMGVIRARARTGAEAMLRGAPVQDDLGELVRDFWRWCTSTKNRAYLRLLFEVHGLALQYPKSYAGYLEGSVKHWIELLTGALRARLGREAEAIATLIVGTIDGLLMDYLSTGDLNRTTQAIESLASGHRALTRAQTHRKSKRRTSP